MPGRKSQQMIAIVPSEEYEKIKDLAKWQNMSISTMVRIAIADYARAKGVELNLEVEMGNPLHRQKSAVLEGKN